MAGNVAGDKKITQTFALRSYNLVLVTYKSGNGLKAFFRKFKQGGEICIFRKKMKI